MGKESKMDKDMNDLKDKEAGEKDRDPGGLNKKPKLKALNPMIFLVVIILLCAIASYVVPAGSFARVTNAATGGEVVDPGSFQYMAGLLSAYSLC